MTDRNAAGRILATAYNVVVSQRGSTHGNADDSFATIAKMWSIYLSAKHTANITVEPKDVAQMMVLLKMGRSLYGEKATPDHYVDQAGYSGLAAMLAGLDVQGVGMQQLEPGFDPRASFKAPRKDDAPNHWAKGVADPYSKTNAADYSKTNLGKAMGAVDEALKSETEKIKEKYKASGQYIPAKGEDDGA